MKKFLDVVDFVKLKSILSNQKLFYMGMNKKKEKGKGKENEKSTKKEIKKTDDIGKDMGNELTKAVNDFLLNQQPKERVIKSPSQFKKDQKLHEINAIITKKELEYCDAKCFETSMIGMEAIDSIPEPLRSEALKIDFTPFPMHFIGVPTTTPKIPEFIGLLREKDDKD
jgi:hypothetical protein